MFNEDRNEESLRSSTRTHFDSARCPVGEIPSYRFQPSKISLSATEQRSTKDAIYEPRSIDDLTTQFSQTRISTRRSNEHHKHPPATVAHQADAIRNVIQEVLAHDLKSPSGEKIQSDHPCFKFARQYAKKWAISDEAVQSHIKLACGYLTFPVILLLNPAPRHEHLPFDQMVKECRTLKWIEDVLAEIGLELADVIILDACTLLSNGYINELEIVGRKDEALSEAYDVTQKMLQMLKPNIILSCQCSTSFSQWGAGRHLIARELCSSIQRAKNREVRKVAINGHILNVVQAYHPSGFLRGDRGRKRKSHHDPTGELLRGLFERVYLPCFLWKSQYIMALKAMASISTDASVEDDYVKDNSRRKSATKTSATTRSTYK